VAVWETGLLRLLDDPNVPIDNRGTERCLHGVVVGHKVLDATLDDQQKSNRASRKESRFVN